jgi:signal transduction histidine kinase
LLAFSSLAQAQIDKNPVDISKVHFSMPLNGLAFFEANDNFVAEDTMIRIRFSQKFLLELPTGNPLKVSGKNIYLKFTACNSSDSIVQAYFFPGLFFTDIKVFKSISDPQNKNFHQIEKIRFDDYISSSLALLTLQPNETSDFFIMISPLRSRTSMFSPQILNERFARYFITDISSEPTGLVTYIISGLLLMMIFYSFAIYLQDFKKEFLYYSAYAACTVLFLFLKSYLDNFSIAVNYYFEGYFDFILQSAGFLFYIGFMRNFLHSAKDHSFLEYVFRSSQWITICFLSLFSVTYFFTDSFIAVYIIENLTKFVLVTSTILFIIYESSLKDKVINYLIAGQSMLILFSVISFAMIMTTVSIVKDKNSMFNDPMLYYEAGVTLELAFFFTALAYKNKKDRTENEKETIRIKIDNEKKDFEKQLAVIAVKNDERNRIAADMHDELGSGVTAIRMMSEIVKAKMQGQSFPEIEKISHSANEVLDKMNAIVWTMNSSNDSLESLIAYIRSHAMEFFENTSIDCCVHVPSNIPAKEISGEKRSNIFLSVKESLNNVMKHSYADSVTINMIIDKELVIEIHDNGKGIDMEKLKRFGNGVGNMKKRMEHIGGKFCMEQNHGTTVIFSVKL